MKGYIQSEENPNVWQKVFVPECARTESGTTKITPDFGSFLRSFNPNIEGDEEHIRKVLANENKVPISDVMKFALTGEDSEKIIICLGIIDSNV